jgi:UTP-glucose-1-phosphate uridylyltransferase
MRQMTELRDARRLRGDRRDAGRGRRRRQLRDRRDGAARRRRAPIARIVEKPKPGTTPSTLAVVGRYVLTRASFHHSAHDARRRGRRDPADRWHRALIAEKRVLAYAFEGRRYDCGSKLGYLEATVDLRPQASGARRDFAAFLRRAARSSRR